MPTRKKPFNYKSALKSLRGKVTFDYDLRHTLTSGKKSAIRKAHNEFSRMKSARLIKPPKHRFESDKHFEKRLKQLKKGYAQSSSLAKGIFIQVPVGAKFRIKDNQIKIGVPEKRYTETYVPLNLARFLADPTAYIKQIIRGRYVRVIYPMHTAYRSMGYAVDMLEEFIDYIYDLLERYKYNPNVLTGFILGTYF